MFFKIKFVYLDAEEWETGSFSAKIRKKYYTKSPRECSKTKNGNKMYKTEKEEKKTIFVHKWHNYLCGIYYTINKKSPGTKK